MVERQSVTPLPKVAVIIVNWNSGQVLHDCLAAIELQTLRAWKTIVVDNGSTDGSAVAASALFPGVEWIVLTRNTGFAHANNLAVERTGDAEWIALLNPDARPEPEWLENLLRSARSRSEFAFFASRLVSARDGMLLDGVGDAYHVSGLPRRMGHDVPAARRFTVASEVFSACAAAALYRRDAFIEAGGFDQDFFCYVEDVDLGFRLRLLGHRCLYVPDAIVHHLGSASAGKGSNFYVYQGQRNLVWTYLKDMPGVYFWLFLFPHVFLNLISIFRFALRGQALVALRAKRDALADLPLILRKRRAIQASRKVSGWKVLRHMSFGWPNRVSC